MEGMRLPNHAGVDQVPEAHCAGEVRPNVNSHSVVRLKLRKHPTIDYGGGTLDETLETAGRQGESKSRAVGVRLVEEAEDKTLNSQFHGPQGAPPLRDNGALYPAVRTGLVRSLSNNW